MKTLSWRKNLIAFFVVGAVAGGYTSPAAATTGVANNQVVSSNIVTNHYTTTYQAGENETVSIAKLNAKNKLAQEALNDLPVFVSAIKQLSNKKYQEMYQTIQSGFAEVSNENYIVTTNNGALKITISGDVSFDVEEVSRKMRLFNTNDDFAIQVRDLKVTKDLLSLQLDQTLLNFEQLPKNEITTKSNAILVKQAELKKSISIIEPNTSTAKLLAHNIGQRENELKINRLAFDLKTQYLKNRNDKLDASRQYASLIIESLSNDKPSQTYLQWQRLNKKMAQYIQNAPFTFEVISIENKQATIEITTKDKVASNILPYFSSYQYAFGRTDPTPETLAIFGDDFNALKNDGVAFDFIRDNYALNAPSNAFVPVPLYGSFFKIDNAYYFTYGTSYIENFTDKAKAKESLEKRMNPKTETFAGKFTFEIRCGAHVKKLSLEEFSSKGTGMSSNKRQMTIPVADLEHFGIQVTVTNESSYAIDTQSYVNARIKPVPKWAKMPSDRYFYNIAKQDLGM